MKNCLEDEAAGAQDTIILTGMLTAPLPTKSV